MLRRCLLTLGLCLIWAPGVLRAQTLADYDYENLEFRGVGLAIGPIWPTKVKPTLGYSARVDLGYLGPGVRITPSVSYWSASVRDAELMRLAESLNRLPPLQGSGVLITGEDLGEIRWSALALDLDGQYVWTTPVGVLPYVGAGAGVHFLNGPADAIGGTFVEDLLDSVQPGVNVLAGVEWELGPRLRLYGEGRFTALSDIQHAGVRIGGAILVTGPRPGLTGNNRE
jgi:hypothetical protein